MDNVQPVESAMLAAVYAAHRDLPSGCRSGNGRASVVETILMRDLRSNTPDEGPLGAAAIPQHPKGN